MAQAIRKVDSMEDLRAHFVKSVQNTFQQYHLSYEELCETLAQLVLQTVDALGPGVHHTAHSVFLWLTMFIIV